MKTNITKAQFEAAKLLEGALHGDAYAGLKLIEGISTSDLPVQLTPALNRIALNEYAEQPTIWRSFAARETLPDFNIGEYFQFSGWSDEDVEPSTAGDTFHAGGLPTVPEYGEYSRLRFAAAEQQLRLKKAGVALQFSWESLIDTRNFGLITRGWSEFGRRAAVKEDHEATLQLLSTGASGNFSVANNNVLTGNLSLSIPALEAAFQQIALQEFNNRRVTPAGSYALVVPPALVATANHIKTVTDIETVEGIGTGTETRYRSGNPVASRFTVVENPYIAQLGGSDSNWWLVPTPGSTPNPSVVNLFLQGNESPQFFVKRTTNSAPEAGSFDNDDYEQKVRHTVTGSFISPAATLYSAGTDD